MGHMQLYNAYECILSIKIANIHNLHSNSYAYRNILDEAIFCGKFLSMKFNEIGRYSNDMTI